MNLMVTLIVFRKDYFLLAVMLVGLAALLKRPSLARIGSLVAVLAFALSVLTPPINQARVMHEYSYGDFRGGSPQERLGYHIEYAKGLRILLPETQERSSFIRLHTTAWAAFIVTQYDVGIPGETISGALYALVPRALWPDKPLVSSAGAELNRMLTGRDTSALGAPVFADAYWNFGWAGLLLFLPTGFFIWWASLRAKEIVQTRNWIMMPFVVAVFLIGISVDNHFVVMWLAPAIISVALYMGLRFASHMIVQTAVARTRPSV
jgi:hypothetical protein